MLVLLGTYLKNLNKRGWFGPQLQKISANFFRECLKQFLGNYDRSAKLSILPKKRETSFSINPLTPNDHYSGRNAPLTSKRCILYIYTTNIETEYFKHGVCSPFFFLSSKCSLFHNSNVFGSCFIHILYTGCAKIKKIIRASKVKLKQSGSAYSHVNKQAYREIMQQNYFEMSQCQRNKEP